MTICTYISYCAFVTLYLYIGTLRTMNASTWKKVADIVVKTTAVTLQASAAATTESHNLQSLQLSTLSIEDSGPPQVTYKPQQPIAMSTPRATDNSETPTEAYHQILPGMTSWKKVADIVVKTTTVTPQASAAATTESHNLQSLQLSTLSIEDSGPPQVTYKPQQPIAMSTPRATDNSETPTEAYHQILPGMTSRLYPTLVADSLLEAH